MLQFFSDVLFSGYGKRASLEAVLYCSGSDYKKFSRDWVNLLGWRTVFRQGKSVGLERCCYCHCQQVVEFPLPWAQDIQLGQSQSCQWFPLLTADVLTLNVRVTKITQRPPKCRGSDNQGQAMTLEILLKHQVSIGDSFLCLSR